MATTSCPVKRLWSTIRNTRKDFPGSVSGSQMSLDPEILQIGVYFVLG